MGGVESPHSLSTGPRCTLIGADSRSKPENSSHGISALHGFNISTFNVRRRYPRLKCQHPPWYSAPGRFLLTTHTNDINHSLFVNTMCPDLSPAFMRVSRKGSSKPPCKPHPVCLKRLTRPHPGASQSAFCCATANIDAVPHTAPPVPALSCGGRSLPPLDFDFM